MPGLSGGFELWDRVFEWLGLRYRSGAFLDIALEGSVDCDPLEACESWGREAAFLDGDLTESSRALLLPWLLLWLL